MPPVITVLSANLNDVLSNSSAFKGIGSITSPSNLYRPKREKKIEKNAFFAQRRKPQTDPKRIQDKLLETTNRYKNVTSNLYILPAKK